MFKPNLKGYIVGNGVTNWTYDTMPAYLSMGYWHSLYDTRLYAQMQAANCDFSGPYQRNVSEECEGYAEEFASYTQYVNVYDIFGICWGRGDYPNFELYSSPGVNKAKKSGISFADYTPWLYPKNK